MKLRVLVFALLVGIFPALVWGQAAITGKISRSSHRYVRQRRRWRKGHRHRCRINDAAYGHHSIGRELFV